MKPQGTKLSLKPLSFCFLIFKLRCIFSCSLYSCMNSDCFLFWVSVCACIFVDVSFWVCFDLKIHWQGSDRTHPKALLMLVWLQWGRCKSALYDRHQTVGGNLVLFDFWLQNKTCVLEIPLLSQWFRGFDYRFIFCWLSLSKK